MTANQNQSTQTTEISFNQLLNNELELLNSLKQLMLNEKAAVENNQVEELIPIAEVKQQILEQVEKASFNRQHFLNKHVQGQSGLAQLETYVMTTRSPDNLMAQFNSLQQTLQDCQDLNNTNAKIIAMSQKTVERNLNILKGVDENAMVYTADGSTEASQSRLNGVKA